MLTLALRRARTWLRVGRNCWHAWDGCNEQARKRQLIEQRLQDKLRKETDSVRRAEEAKREKTSANRKEEELQLKDSIVRAFKPTRLEGSTDISQHKLRRTRLPLLANFLSTSDHIPLDDTPPPPTNPLAQPPRQHPPPVYYLPAKLLPSQEAFLARRVAEVCPTHDCTCLYADSLVFRSRKRQKKNGRRSGPSARQASRR